MDKPSLCLTAAPPTMQRSNGFWPQELFHCTPNADSKSNHNLNRFCPANSKSSMLKSEICHKKKSVNSKISNWGHGI